jgi:pimeloyl-ACP methyl ester carboxylesterase
MRLRRLALAALALLLFVLLAALAAGWFLTRPQNSAVPAPASPGRVVRLVANDGVPIIGSYWPGAHADGPAILLLHGINNTRDRLSRQALWLNGLGYAVLAVDFRGHGESGAVQRSFGWEESRDARAAVAFLRAGSPHRRIGVIGVSLGGAASLTGPEGPLPVEAMVLQAVYPDLRTAIANRIARVGGRWIAWLGEPLLSYQAWPRYGVSPALIAPIAGIARYPGRVLIIGGTADRDTAAADTLALYAAAAGPKELWLIEGADHLATSILWSDDYRRRVGAFFARSLGNPELEAAKLDSEPGRESFVALPCAISPSCSMRSSTRARARPS